MIFEHFYRDDRSMTTAWEKLSRYAPLWAMAGLYFGLRTIVLGGIIRIVLRPNLSWYETGLCFFGCEIWKAERHYQIVDF